MTHRTGIRALLAIALFGLLAACDNMGLNKDDDAAARRAYEQIGKGDFAALAKWSDVEMKSADPAALKQLYSYIPDAKPTAVKVTGWKYNVSTGSGNTLQTTHEYDYADRTVVADTVMRRPSAGLPWKIAGIHIKAEPKAAAASDAPASDAAKTEPADS
jgi:hypothetical protein